MTQEEFELRLNNLYFKKNTMSIGEYHQALAKLIHKFADSEDFKEVISISELRNKSSHLELSRIRKK